MDKFLLTLKRKVQFIQNEFILKKKKIKIQIVFNYIYMDLEISKIILATISFIFVKILNNLWIGIIPQWRWGLKPFRGMPNATVVIQVLI